MNLPHICSLCIAIFSIVVVEPVDSNVLRGEMALPFKQLKAQKESTDIAATSAEIICSLCRRENNITCIQQWCTNDVILGRESVVSFTADIICSLCRQKHNIICIQQWCTNDVIVSWKKDVNAKNPGAQVRRHVLNDLSVGVGTVRPVVVPEKDMFTSKLKSSNVDKTFSPYKYAFHLINLITTTISKTNKNGQVTIDVKT